MSYKDGLNVQGSHSPYTVWLKHSGGYVVGVDFRCLNKRIKHYNDKRMHMYVNFWCWYSYNEFGDADAITGFSALWNEHNVNMEKVLQIK